MDVMIELTLPEVLQLRRAGTNLELEDKTSIEHKMGIPDSRQVALSQRTFVYEMKGMCGNLDPDTGDCTDYANRPGICQMFKPRDCTDTMRERGINPPDPVFLPIPRVQLGFPDQSME